MSEDIKILNDNQVSEEVFKAVMRLVTPHIREKVAEELRAAADLLSAQEPLTYYREGLVDGLQRGARIARGATP